MKLGLKTLAVSAFIGLGMLSAPVAAQDLKVAAISGYFSQGFGISIIKGLERAKGDFGVDLKIVDTGNRALDYEEQFNNLAKDGQYDLIFVMGWELVDALQKSNKAYPNQKFIFIDGVLDSPTMTYIDFVEEEGSFLVGALAGLMTSQQVEGFDSSSQVGFVGGRDIPVIRNFLTGMEQGVAQVASDVSVSSVFAGTFDDPAKGSELAMALYGQDVDLLYQAAGPTGEGVLQAARAAGKYAIGVDVDQCPTAPGAMLASMLKRADIAVYDLIKGEVDGNPVKPGAYAYGVKSGGVELKICDDMKDRVPADITAKLEEARKGIADGTIAVKMNQ
ncbi:BMP family ABC transporter substrate-binding protein [Ochrobactrum sp. BTU2]|uniref:BMP family lipoprotein n=1 Tax=Ochrobactrum sp. BTU2 TaxID=2856166 RepID=UPI00211A7E21|nr:BMP family ABC transporter substrate-binding protein [Ochrobactrum sp. BTU2]MCQ9148124.1 BMP family ABC transporter substrate-binding protein [Ochrobactrum sp. BTU2]